MPKVSCWCSPSTGAQPGSQNHEDRLAVAQARLNEWHQPTPISRPISIQGVSASPQFVTSTFSRNRDSMSPSVPPCRSVSCRCENLSISASLRLLSVLNVFHIRLCKSPHHRLQEMAHDSARKACRIATSYCRPSSMLTTFVSLPRGLRLRILQSTDLATPWKGNRNAVQRHMDGRALVPDR